MGWEAIFAAAIAVGIEFIRECLGRGSSDRDVVTELRGRRPLGRRRYERRLRDRLGLSWREWRREGPAIMSRLDQEVNSSTDDELLSLVAEAREAEETWTLAD